MSTALARAHLAALRIYRRLPVKARRRVVRTIAPAYTVGAICVIGRDDRSVLLVRLTYRNSWGLPGGLLKRGEAPEEAALREVKEESTLDVELLGDPAVVVDPTARRVDVVFQAGLPPGVDPRDAVASSPEIVEVGWFAEDQLPDLQHEASSAMVALARRRVVPPAD